MITCSLADRTGGTRRKYKGSIYEYMYLSVEEKCGDRRENLPHPRVLFEDPE